MKRLFIILTLILLILTFSGAAMQVESFYEEEPINYITLYSLDGREEIVAEEEVNAQLTVGWYLEPMTVLYAKDGRTEIIPLREKEAQLQVGWYEQPININYSAFEKTNIPASCLDKVLEGTSLAGCGIYFYNMEQTYGVNSIFAIAVAENESSLGKHNANKNNFWGRKKAKGGWMHWESKEESIMDFGRYMNRVYPGMTIDRIGPKYCPSPSGWANRVKSFMTKRYNKF
jgi:hypothetical protein